MSDKFEKSATQNNDSFVWEVPCRFIKGEGDKPWQIEGLASTSHRDAQGEIVDQTGLDISHLKAKKGFFNEDHKPGIEHKVGKITEAEQKKEGLLVKGYLFKNSAKAKAFHDIMTSLEKGDESSVKMSIEGKIVKRGSDSKILKAKVTGVALTLNPVNENTYARFIKSLEAQGCDIKEDFGVLESSGSDEKLESALVGSSATGGEMVTSSTMAPLSPNDFDCEMVKIDSQYALVDKMKLAKAIKLSKMVIEKSQEKQDDTEKAMSTGSYDSAPGTLTGGAAWATESMDKKKKLKKRLNKNMDERAKFTALFKQLRKSYPNIAINKVLELTCVIFEDKGDKLFKTDSKE